MAEVDLVSTRTPQDQRIARWRIRIFAITWLAYAGLYFTRQAFSSAKLGILQDSSMSSVTREMMGVIDALYLAAYAVGQFLWGPIADKRGSRVVVLVGLALSALVAIAIGVTYSLPLFIALMIIQGFAQSSGWAPLAKNLSAFFAVRERGRVFGWWTTNYALGGLLAGPFAGWWAYSIVHTWRAAFVSTGTVVFVVFVLFIFAQRNTPRDAGLGELDIERWVDGQHPRSLPADVGEGKPRTAVSTETVEPGPDAPPTKNTHRSARASFVAAVKDRKILTLALCYFLLKPARYAILLWGPVIVSQRLPSASNIQAVLIPIAFGFGGIFGPVAVGWMSDKLFGSRRVPPTIIALLGLIVSLAAFMPLTSTRSVAVMVAVLFVIGVTMYAADSVMSGSAAVDSGSQEHAGAAVGFINGTGAVGAVLGGLLPGFISGDALFFGFAVASALCIPLLLPMWRWRASAA